MKTGSKKQQGKAHKNAIPRYYDHDQSPIAAHKPSKHAKGKKGAKK